MDVAYLDTGAMFRAVALHLGEAAAALPGDELQARLRELRFALRGVGENSVLLVNDQPLGDEIRTEEVAMLASTLAKLPEVRAFLKQAQQAIGAATDLAAEGRDMGAVVFPQAWRKFFLDADPAERARRRWLQLREMGVERGLRELEAQIRQRDDQDRNRAESPLRPAQDAIRIDTTALDIEQVFAAIMAASSGES